METFFILFVIIFVPFIWFINCALKYTKETVGEDAPLHRERTYQLGAYQYFGTFTKVLEAFLLVMSLVLAYILINVGIDQDQLIGFIFAPFFIAFAGFLGFYFYFDWQYWTITQNVSFTLNPHGQSITIESPDQSSVITPDTAIRIEHHLQKIDNAKNPLAGYGYYLFYQSDGQIIQLNNLFISHIGHVEFMERYFAHVPQAIVWHRLAWPTDDKQVEIP